MLSVTNKLTFFYENPCLLILDIVVKLEARIMVCKSCLC